LPAPSRWTSFLTPANLALLYHTQGKYAQAEPLFRRSLATLTKALGPDHPNVATYLENYASLPRKIGRNAEAAKMEARAQAIRATHGQENPKK
jgi:tetratricopeptide (TPR) repeat protein